MRTVIRLLSKCSLAGRLAVSVFCAVAVVSACPGFAQAQIIANLADDVCAPSENPCVITETVLLQQNATLDFGTRDVVVNTGGVLEFGANSAVVLCGNFTMSVGTTIGIDANAGGGGSVIGGSVRIAARRACSANPTVPCLRDFTCTSLSLGTCSVGTGNMVVNGRLVGSAELAASVDLAAAGDLSILQPINIDGTTLDSDGGDVELEAVAGTLAINAKISATGGGFSAGGTVTGAAGADILVSDVIDLDGGESDGGALALSADRDVFVSADLQLSSKNLDGFGGTLEIDAGRDLVIVGGSAANRLVVAANGNASSEASGGDGGTQDYTAGRDITIGPFVRLESNGARPDGFGEDITADAGGSITIDGVVQTKARGGQGGGGIIEIAFDGNLDVGATALFDATGSESGAGAVEILGGGDLTYAGSTDVTATNGGTAGEFFVSVGRDIEISGSVLSNGGDALVGGNVLLSGCFVDLIVGANIDNRADFSTNTLIARTQASVRAGASLSAGGSNASNTVRYRNANIPPLLSGIVSPSPVLELDETLPSCPACGNGVLDDGETCDDGNVSGGDGCSFTCQDEGCVADTPGFPGLALCDDQQACSADSCNTAEHRCEHIFPCDDGIACTAESCNGTACISTPTDALCDDANGCSIDVCVDAVGCQYSTANDGTMCDDGSFCNGVDSCVGGLCSVHAGDPCPGASTGCSGLCNETGDSCQSPAGTPCESDGNPCTDDVCSGSGACGHHFNLAPCDDGIFCNGPDLCVAGSCLFHTGNPCVFGPQCANICNELGSTCNLSAGTSCSVDSNVCTDDVCDGSGACTATPNSDPCDDGDFCTLSDVCSAGACTAAAGGRLDDARFKSTVKPGAASDRLIMKSESPASALTGLPTDTGMTLKFFDSARAEFFSSTIPASAFADRKGDGTNFRFRDRDGAIVSANGVERISVKIRASGDVVKIKAKARGIDVSGAVGQSSGAVSVLFGADPAGSPCFTGRDMFCTGSLTKRTCKTR